MEPISITADTLSIITFASKLAFKSNGIVEEVRGAPKALADLKDEILSLREIVAQLDPGVESNGSVNPELNRLLSLNMETLKELETTVKSLQSSLRRSRFGLTKYLFTSHQAELQSL
ncbi:hypothetical protein BCR34DRAFT_596882 [Clohesyomyces aquaticus]|uniref:Azaphilone pigments biosynthesis cluster protein L N-terminal domain-containing protein n=1 Tax=Clohesyomyces aquaticus TaxID=1231657 RepID=A0A1Y2A4G2_9PLEO|nr:hypothetical protein BCR34DRAFT_596882 [Clohesyomyces aquaticus]